jgi:hypothetical protein
MGTKIWGRPKDGDAEVIDETYRGGDSAEYLVGEYQMAFGPSWKIWAGRKKDEPHETSNHVKLSGY